MALGMQFPKYYSSEHDWKQGPSPRTLNPSRMWQVQASFTGKSYDVEQNGMTLFTTDSHSWRVKHTTLTIHERGEKTAVVGGIRPDGTGHYSLYLGNPLSDNGTNKQQCQAKRGSNGSAHQYSFNPPTAATEYAWRGTRHDEITLAGTSNGSTGRDWKLISLTPDGEENELLALYLNHPKASMRHKGQLYWFTDLHPELEIWCLAAIIGMIERMKRQGGSANPAVAMAPLVAGGSGAC